MQQFNDNTIIGIDFSSAYTQVSYLDENRAVQSLSTIDGEQRYLIPTQLLKYKGRPVWCIGDEAVLRASEAAGTLVPDLFAVLKSEQGIQIEDRHYTGTELLRIFLRELHVVIQANLKIKRVTHAVVSIESPHRRAVEVLTEALMQLGIEQEHIRIISHTESFLYYVLHQKRELWNNQVVMLDFGRNGCICRIMKVVSQRGKYFVLTEEHDFSQKLDMGMLETANQMEQADRIFLSLLQPLFQGRVVSSVYLTGEGFQKSWAKESIQYLCNKRRVFQGNNLIVKGTGYCAREYFYATTLERFLFQCPGLTKVNVALKTNRSGVESEQLLSKAGVRWYETDAYVEGILDRVSHLTLQISSPVTGIEKVIYLELKNFPRRPHKTTRVGVRLYYTEADQFMIEAVDLGFGDFFPASGEKVRETVTVTQELERRLP